MFLKLFFKSKKAKIVSAHAKKKPEAVTYLISSLFLHENFDLLKSDSIETFYYVTGPEIGGIKILDRIEKFGYEERSGVFAKAITQDSTRILINLDLYGHRLWGYFHSHTASGAYGASPSIVDLNLRDTFDRGGYKAIGVIFSKDGFIRFFSSKPFKIVIYGEGVVRINEELFHLVKI